MSEEEREGFNTRADDLNVENGLPRAEKKSSKPKATAKKAEAEAPTEDEEKPPAKKTANAVHAVSKDTATGMWLVKGTTFVAKSPANKVIQGKLVKGKLVALTPADKKEVEKMGLTIEAPAKKSIAEEDDDS